MDAFNLHFTKIAIVLSKVMEKHVHGILYIAGIIFFISVNQDLGLTIRLRWPDKIS